MRASNDAWRLVSPPLRTARITSKRKKSDLRAMAAGVRAIIVSLASQRVLAISNRMKPTAPKSVDVPGRRAKAPIAQPAAAAPPPADMPPNGMMAEERRQQILHTIRTEGRAKVNDLVRRFQTSAVTIRSDLNELDSRGLIQRSHGGAVIQNTIFRESPLEERSSSQSLEKQRIGALAATMIHEGETIILDSGTTTLEIARNLRDARNIQVLTNGLNIAAELLAARSVQTIIMGGTLRTDSASVVGRSTEDMLEQFSADKLFLCGAGCDPDFGVSGTNLDETMANRAMLRAAREIIVVADSSKFTRRSMSLIATFAEVDLVISDAGMPPEMQDRIRALGCKLLLA